MAVSSSPGCGCLGCHDDATTRVRVPGKGLRTVCDYHATGHEVVEVLDDE